MDLSEQVKLDIVWKRYQGRTSSSIKKHYFEEREAPASFYPVAHNLQLYTQSEQITADVPTDVLNLADTDLDDNGSAIAGSYYGRTSVVVPILKRYIKVPLVPVPTPYGSAFQAPRSITCASPTAFTVGEFITGSTSGTRAKVIAVQGAFVFYTANWSGHSDFQSGETITGASSSLTASILQDSSSCVLSMVLKNAIAFDYGNGGYAHRVYSSTGTQVKFGDGNWLVDVSSGVLTFYGTLPAGVSASSPPLISFYRYIGNIGLNITNGLDGKVGIATTNPAVSLEITATDAIRIPVGSSAERPTPPKTGYLRYNTDIQEYEGYATTGWESLLKGTGVGSDDVNIGTGGADRVITVGNSSGNTSIDMLAGTGDITLRNNNGIVVDAASAISMSTRGPGPSSVNFGNNVDDLSINFYATGTRSSINFFGVTNLHLDTSTLSQIISGTLDAIIDDGVWKMSLGPDSSGTLTSLQFQRRENGIFVTKYQLQ